MPEPEMDEIREALAANDFSKARRLLETFLTANCMWATLILPLATTFKAPVCLEFVARHVVTGLAVAFQTLTPQTIHSIKKHTKIRKKSFDLRRQQFRIRDGFRST